MKVYNLTRTQFFPVNAKEAWDFFSTPDNLLKITPVEMGMTPLYMSGGKKAYEGQIIRYKIRIFAGFSVHWVTEITHISEPYYFVDDQRFGPYAMWHHQHHFKEVSGGVEMTDIVNYGIPLGILGRFAHFLFVGRMVTSVFDHRWAVLEKYFGKDVRKEA